MHRVGTEIEIEILQVRGVSDVPSPSLSCKMKAVSPIWRVHSQLKTTYEERKSLPEFGNLILGE